MNKEHFLKVMPQDQITEAIAMWGEGECNPIEAFYEALEDEDELQNIIDYFLPHCVEDVVEEVREQLFKATEGSKPRDWQTSAPIIVHLREELKPYVLLDADRFALDVDGFRESRAFVWKVDINFNIDSFTSGINTVHTKNYIYVAVYAERKQ